MARDSQAPAPASPQSDACPPQFEGAGARPAGKRPKKGKEAPRRRRIFRAKTGKDTDRSELAEALEFMQPGDTEDTVVVPHSLDRFGRSPNNLITVVGDLRKRSQNWMICVRSSA